MRHKTKDVDAILSQNYQILRGYAHNTLIQRDVLQTKGFDFAYQTHTVSSKNGVLWIAIYDRAYQFSDSSKKEVKIIDLTIS